MARIYPVDNSNEAIIVNKEYCYEFARWDDGTIRWAIRNVGGWTWINTEYTVPLNEWYHVAIVYESTLSIKTFVDGDLKHACSWGSGNIASAESEFRIGNRSIADRPFKGIIDDVMLFNRALTDEEIKDIYQHGGYGDYNGKLLVGFKRLPNDLKFGTITIHEFRGD